MASEQQLADLTNIGKKALNEYDDLLRKYNKLVSDHEETKEELDRLQEVAEPMYAEYGQMQTKYEMEVSLRSAAETYANKVLKDNKKIKRQSAMILAQMSAEKPVAVDIDIDDSNSTQDDRIEELGKTIIKLQDEVASNKAELLEARDEINILHTQIDEVTLEREEYKMKCLVMEKDLNSSTEAVKKHQKELKSLNRASTLAVVDYASLEEKYETERILRLKAESYAGELQRKRASLLEPSQAPGTESDLLIKLKEENDQLHADLSEQEIKYKTEVDGLQQQLNDSTSHGVIENLEEKLEVVKDDMERLNEALNTQKKENKELRDKITKMEKEQADALNIPLPPPPPPPPGPAAGIGRLIISKKKKKEHKLNKIVGTDAVKDQAMKNALEDMMKRIKSGNLTLKPVNTKTQPDDAEPKDDSAGTVNEMRNYLVSMKSKRRVRSPVREDNAANELQKILAARRERSNSIDSPAAANREQNRRSNSFSGENASADLTRSQLNQGSPRTPPAPKPRPRQSTKNKTNAGNSNDLA